MASMIMHFLDYHHLGSLGDSDSVNNYCNSILNIPFTH